MEATPPKCDDRMAEGLVQEDVDCISSFSLLRDSIRMFERLEGPKDRSRHTRILLCSNRESFDSQKSVCQIQANVNA